MTEVEPGDSLLRIPSFQGVLKVDGLVPIADLIYQLRKQEVISKYPPSGLISGIPVEAINSDGNTRICDAIRAVEEACGWVFDLKKREFYVARATHGVDGPDEFGRPSTDHRASMEPRSMVNISFRFRRIAGAITADEVSASAAGTGFTASLPDGVRESWNSVTERSYFEGVTSAKSDDPTTVETERKTVESGLQITALAARLPGGLFRIDGRLSISQFVGKTLDRAVVDFPLQVDGPRGRWVRTLVIKGSDVGARVAFRQFDIDPSGSGDALELCVMVE